MTRKICFAPTGQSLEPLTNNPYEGVAYLACPALVRDPSADCPASTAVCSLSHCSVKSVTGTGAPTKVGNDCCYDSSVCLGASGCGRPLVVSGFSRLAGLARGASWLVERG